MIVMSHKYSYIVHIGCSCGTQQLEDLQYITDRAPVLVHYLEELQN